MNNIENIKTSQNFALKSRTYTQLNLYLFSCEFVILKIEYGCSDRDSLALKKDGFINNN